MEGRRSGRGRGEEGKGVERREKKKTSMDSDGEQRAGPRCKRSRHTQDPVHGLGTLN